MNRYAFPVVLLLLLGGRASLAAEPAPAEASPPPPPPMTAQDSEDLAEIEVVGKSLRKLEREVIAAEDRFYDLYNTLNTDHSLDIHCTYEAPTGSQVKRRKCLPAFIEKEQQESAIAFVNQLRGEMGTVAPSSNSNELTQLHRSRENMRALVANNPELLRLIRERFLLEVAFKKARAERMNGHRIYFD